MIRTLAVLAAVFAATSVSPGEARAHERGARFVLAGPAVQIGVGRGGHWRGGGHRHGGWRWGIGIGLGWPGYFGYPYAVPVYPAPLVAVPPPVDDADTPRPVPAAKAPPDPVIYPRNGQSPAQTETDRQDCNRWATTQPQALADASVFHRATIACMEGRGYTVR